MYKLSSVNLSFSKKLYIKARSSGSLVPKHHKMSFILGLTPLSFILLLLLDPILARVLERCELAGILRHQYGLPEAQVATLVCIAQHSSELNTAAFGGGSGPGGGSHGIFQISDVYWCSPPGQGAGCGLSCARLRDDDIADDVLCVRKIFAEHQRISGDGFTAWKAYNAYCRQDAASYVTGCHAGSSGGHNNALQVAASYQHPQQVQVGYQNQQQVIYQQPQIPRQDPRRYPGKIYNRCELAQELYYQHKLPMKQIPTWVCIAQHESSYNTAAVGRLNADGSADHGLFQISDLFWCTHDQRGGKGCRASCNQFLDSSIADDVQCIRRIHQEHTQISGDGFTAWTVYNRDCRNQRYEQIAACFNKPQVTHPNAIEHGDVKGNYNNYQLAQPTTPNPYYRTNNKLITYQSVQTTSSYQRNPFLPPRKPISQVQQHPNTIGYSQKPNQVSPSNPLLSYKQHSTPKQQEHYQHFAQQQHYQHLYTTPKAAGKVYSRCELAQELYFSHKFPMQDLATWVCIAQHESSFNTAAVGRLNQDGSEDHGLFQISDLYWCTHSEDNVGGKGCSIDCRHLLDSDISDDVKCIRTIHEEHTRISGDGFTAWTVYNQHCRDKSSSEIASCFQLNELEPVVPIESKPEKPKPKGKIYNRCELAKELYYQHKLPIREIPTWVCIAEHESSYNTAAVGRLNNDGSEDHGLFQISDLYWCTHNEGSGGKACHIDCDRLLDSDITDDVKCIQTIHEEHTRLSGDGFNAWTVYNGHCRQQSLTQLSDCFEGNEIDWTEESSQDLRPTKPTVSTNSERLSPVSVTPASHINHPFGSNPSLQHLRPQNLQQQQHPTKIVPEKIIDYASPPKSSYAGNPFLSKFKVPYANIIQSTVQTKPVTQLQHNQVHESNPFLSALNKPYIMTDINRTKIKTTSGPTKSTVHPYINSDSFRHEFIKFTATTPSTTTQKSRPTTPRVTTETSVVRQTTTASFRQTTTKSTTTIHPTTSKSTTHPTTRPTTRPTATSLSTQPPSRATTHQSTIRPTTHRTTRVATRPTTTRPITHPTTKVTTRQTTTRSITHPTTRVTTRQSTTRSTTQPTTRVTTRQSTTRSTTHPTTRVTTRQTTTRPITHPTTRVTTRQSTTRPTTHPTTRVTTRQWTTRPTTHPTTRVTTRQTTTRPITRPTSTNLSTHPTGIPITRQSTTRSTTRPTIRATSRPTAMILFTNSSTRATTRQTTRSPTTTRATTRPTTTSTTRQSTTSRANTYPIKSTTVSTPRQTTTRTLTSSTRQIPTTNKSTRLTTYQTTTSRPTTRQSIITRTTSRSSTLQASTMRPTLRQITATRSSTTRATTRATTQSTKDHPRTTRSTTRATTRLSTQSTTTRPTARSTIPTTTWRPFILSTSVVPNIRSTPTYNPTTRQSTTTRPFTSTTPRPYLFTASRTPTTITTTTTHRARTTVRNGTNADPFSHPFFAKFNDKFNLNRSLNTTTTTKPTAINNSKESNFNGSPYYAKFQSNSAAAASKTVFAYEYGQNRTITTIRPYKQRFS